MVLSAPYATYEASLESGSNSLVSFFEACSLMLAEQRLKLGFSVSVLENPVFRPHSI